MIRLSRRGLSPVIASALLIALAIVLALIIFFWAKTFFQEKILKENRDISFSCEKVSFEAEAIGRKLRVTNTGSIPINGFEIRKEQFFGVVKKVEPISAGVLTGETAELDLPAPPAVSTGDKIVVMPILLGQSENGERKAYVCSREFSKQVEVR